MEKIPNAINVKVRPVFSVTLYPVHHLPAKIESHCSKCAKSYMVTITKRTFICSVNVDIRSSKVDIDSLHEMDGWLGFNGILSIHYTSASLL